MTDRLTDEQLDALRAKFFRGSMEGIIFAELIVLAKQAKEANRLERELARAMGVVDSAASWQEDTGSCHFCDFDGHRSPIGGDIYAPHAPDCPLVEHGFCDQEGKRTK